MYGDTKELAETIVGKSVTAVHWSEELLTFETDAGMVSYFVEGDCCSHSYFFDFYGVENLLQNGPVTAFEEVTLSPGDPGYLKTTWEVENPDEFEEIAVYGFRFTTEHPKFGPVSSVLSFRNSSNGYYGGWMDPCEGRIDPEQRAVTEDVIG